MEDGLIDKISQFFKKQGQVWSVLIFGSQAKEKATFASDIDIAILCDPQAVPDYQVMLDMREDLVSLLKKEVDLVVLNQANPILKHQIYKNGKIIFNHNSRFYNAFFVRSLNEYDDVKRVRSVIEKNILKRKVYG